MRLALLAALLVACEGCRVDPPLPPDTSPGTCEEWCAAVAPIACGIDPATCLDDCRKTTASEARLGRRFPVGCMTAAAKTGSCEEVWKCR